MEEKGGEAGRTRRTAAKAPAGTASSAAAAKPAAASKASPTKKPAAPRKATARPAVSPAGGAGADRAELVRMAAYFRAERRGFAPGYEIEDWLAAEAEVAAKLGPVPAAAAGKPATRKSKSG